MDLRKIQPGLMVHVRGEAELGGGPGLRVGTVDHIDGNYIKLKRTDSFDGKHRWVPMAMVSHASTQAVYLKCTKEEFQDRALTSPPNKEEAA